jgi:multisubunit Na+/H+ antiporter MnhC subunit
MKQKLAVIAILMIIAGFGMIHSTKGIMEIVSLLLIGIGTAYLLFLLLVNKKKDQPSDEG